MNRKRNLNKVKLMHLKNNKKKKKKKMHLKNNKKKKEKEKEKKTMIIKVGVGDKF